MYSKFPMRCDVQPAAAVVASDPASVAAAIAVSMIFFISKSPIPKFITSCSKSFRESRFRRSFHRSLIGSSLSQFLSSSQRWYYRLWCMSCRLSMTHSYQCCSSLLMLLMPELRLRLLRVRSFSFLSLLSFSWFVCPSD